jgi:hypothetical protein
LESRVAKLEVTSFRQSIIDNVGNSYDKITDNQKHPTFVKIFVGDNIYPRTTNTIFTFYYSSYIDTVFPEWSYEAPQRFLEYYNDSSTSPAIII